MWRMGFFASERRGVSFFTIAFEILEGHLRLFAWHNLLARLYHFGGESKLLAVKDESAFVCL